ncbi:hypothetical protein [Devosia faecipullorum]|uniref:hypothetical protein n=1 Tax=Devosia faecipullorum TaxID=2755039 RepID=UPI00187B38FD|nr:hypothetical protein [Devosia faecipullorum]MBE7731862.1 hypothetical protein [Devosia faecipullorum]
MSMNVELNEGFLRLHRLAVARDLPGIAPSTHEGAPALMVAGAVFVHLLDAKTLVLRCPADQKVLLMEISPDIYFETDLHVGQDVMLIRLDRISDEELSLRLHDAWAFKAPEKLKTTRN